MGGVACCWGGTDSPVPDVVGTVVYELDCVGGGGGEGEAEDGEDEGDCDFHCGYQVWGMRMKSEWRGSDGSSSGSGALSEEIREENPTERTRDVREHS